MQHLKLSLHPGESIRSPRIMQLYWSAGDPNRAYNLFRRTMLAHVVPKCDGRTVTPPIVHMSTSFYELNSSTEANVLSHLEAVKGLGFEMFWLDAYWTRDGFPAGMGHYGFPLERVEPRDRFPHGMQTIRDAVHEAGLKYLMWFEPERVHPGTAIAKEHPDWVISPAGDGSGLFNLGLPEAREFMTRYLAAVIQEYGLDCLRIDFNIDPLPFWEFLNQQDPARVGIGEIRYVEGLYQMWDDLLTTYPHLLIDNCASGGRRIDLETCSRAPPVVEQRQHVRHGRVRSGPHRTRRHQEPAHEPRTEPLCAVQHRGADGIDAVSVPQRLQWRDRVCGGLPPGRLPPRSTAASDRRGEADSSVLVWRFLPAVRADARSIGLVCDAVPPSGRVRWNRRLFSARTIAVCQLRLRTARHRSGRRLRNPAVLRLSAAPAMTIQGRELQNYRAVIDEKPGSVILEYRRVSPR